MKKALKSGRNGNRETEGWKGRVVLPPAGLAEDILGRPPAAASSAQAAVATAEAEGPEAGKEGIYTFADSLNREQETLAQQKVEEKFETWVTFTLAGETYGLPVSHVQEILRVNNVTHVPHAPRPVRGVTNMRGRVLPVVDLRIRLGLAEGELSAQSRVLVVSSRGRLLGLLVDSVQQVIRLPEGDIEPPPPDIMTSQSDYIKGVYTMQNALVIMLEVEKVLHLPSMSS